MDYVGYDQERLAVETKYARQRDPNGRANNNTIEREAKLNQLKELACDKVSDRMISFILQEILEMLP